MHEYWKAVDAVTIFRDAPLRAAAELMQSHGIGSLVVTDEDGKIAGMVTDRDLCTRAVAFDRDPDQATVAGAMTSDIRTMPLDTSAEVRLQAMRSIGTRRLPLVDGSDHPKKVVTADDALLWIVERLAELAETASGERRHGALRPAAELLSDLAAHIERRFDGEPDPALSERLTISRDALLASVESLRSALAGDDA